MFFAILFSNRLMHSVMAVRRHGDKFLGTVFVWSAGMCIKITVMTV